MQVTRRAVTWRDVTWRAIIPSWPMPNTADARMLYSAYLVCLMLDSRQLTSLLLRWTNADALGDNDGGEKSVVGDAADAKAGVAPKEKAVLVGAGLKTVRIVCTKADNNKGGSFCAVCVDLYNSAFFRPCVYGSDRILT